MEKGKVINLNEVRERATSIDIYRGKHSLYTCQHSGVYVYENEPVVACRGCGATLDPIEVLREYAKKERRFVSMVRGAQDELRRLQAEVEQLKRDKKNLKAAIRKARI